MSGHYLGSVPSNHPIGGPILVEPRGFATPRRRVTDRIDAGGLMRFEQEQLEREYADIERATAALRLGEPALQSWSKPVVPAAPPKQPLWLLIGVLWLSTALATAGAVAVIATLAG